MHLRPFNYSHSNIYSEYSNIGNKTKSLRLDLDSTILRQQQMSPYPLRCV